MRLDEVAASPHFREQAALADPRDVVADPVRAGKNLSPDRLLGTLRDPQAPLALRLAAGGTLALFGDPRLGTAPHACFVAGGAVWIGLPADEVDAVTAAWAHVGVIRDWIAKEAPRHEVCLADFWLATYPVTNREYLDYLLDTDAARPSTWYLGAYPYDRANHPVCGVSAQEADGYAAWLSRRTGHPWRLPTEAEWEHAAKGPGDSAYPWGDEFDPRHANTRETGVHTTTPVGAFPLGRAHCGALDMAGNVEEYVADDYLPYPGGEPVTDHLVQTMGRYRVTRGGSFSRFGDLARTRRRHGAFPGNLYPPGFRLATGTRPPQPER